MQAMRLYTQGPVEQQLLKLEELPVPTPAQGEILIQISHCGVCHTDLHLVEGDIQPPRLPITPGHQVVGKIVAAGNNVTTRNIGEVVGVPWLYSACGKCEFCHQGRENLCPHAQFTGFHHDGGFAAYMLAQATFALPIPAGFTPEQAAPLLCAGIIGYRSLKQAEVQPGDVLGLIGFGASAHLAIQVANAWECTSYVFTRSEEHRQHALELGAAWVGGIEDAPPQSLDCAILFAPSGKLVPLILEKLRPAGTLAINAIHLSPIPELPYALIYAERTLRSVANATYQDGVEFLELAAKLTIQATTNLYSLKDANRALLDLKHSRINGEAVLVI